VVIWMTLGAYTCLMDGFRNRSNYPFEASLYGNCPEKVKLC
jgi:hypothetical protein